MSERLKDALRRGPDCPPLEELIEANPARQAHVETCPACQAEIALYQSFQAPVKSGEREDVAYIVSRLKPISKQPVWSRLFSSWFASPARLGGFSLAAALVILSVGLVSRWHSRQSEPISDGGLSVLRSAAIRVETPLDDVAQVPKQIRWQPTEGAQAYEIAVAEVDRTIVFYSKFTEPFLAVPPELAKLLLPGKMFSLRITARDATGKELATSGLLNLRIQLPGQQ